VDVDDRLRLDYEQTNQLLRALVDVRFRLLAFVTTIAAVAVGLFGRPRPASELVAFGLLGFVATLGIFLYELRNSLVHDTLVARATELERRLALASRAGGEATGGLFTELPPRTVRVAGMLIVAQDQGLALVYGAALAGWGYLVGWGALRAIEVEGARGGGALFGLLVGAAVVWEAMRVGATPRA
jgi:hypothetical protein